MNKMVTTPAGREVPIRRMRGKDEDIILDPQLERSGKKITVFLHSITELPETDLDAMLQGERIFLLIEIIKLRDPVIYLPVKSPLGTKFEAEIDLDRLRYLPLNRKLVDENFQYEVTLPVSKKKLRQRLLTGNDETKIRKIAKDHSDKLLTCLYLLRTVSVEGEKNITLSFFEELDSVDRQFLRDEYERHDCGYDTEVTLFDAPNSQEFEHSF